MSPDRNKLEYMAREMMLTEEEIARRKEFLEFTDADIELLREVHAYQEKLLQETAFTDYFYNHMRSFPELHSYISDDATVSRLKDIQTKYFLRLAAGDYGEDYVLDRLKVGYAHQQIGLDPKWYTGAYRKYLSFLLSSLKNMDLENFQNTFDAFLKIVFFDMELALDTYFHSVQKELARLANHDALTGLPNRNLMQDRIEQAIHHARREDACMAVIFVDLDRFKNINDSLGHHAGDKVISTVSNNIMACLREGDTVARLGGDEFVIVLSGVRRGGNIAPVAEKIMQAIEQPIMVEMNEIFVTASMGIAIYPADGESADELLKNSDTAMYQAKQQGRRNFRFYQQEMNIFSLEQLALESRLRHALDRNEFVLHYQPQIDMTSGQIVSAEALIRWQTGDRLVAPEEFIPLAEENGLILSIGEWVLQEACRQVAAWHREGVHTSFRVAVNLSANQFRGHDIAAIVSRILVETECKADWLELEITESTLMEHPDAAAETLGTLGRMGVSIAIDDFGTGYSSLAYLKRFPIHKLKIDRSFVMGIASDQDDASIVRAIIALAHNLKLKVTGEGIEDQAQLSYLQNLGCEYAQGYLVSKPMEAAEIGPVLLDKPVWMTSGDQEKATLSNKQKNHSYDVVKEHQNCRVLRVGQQVLCLAAQSNCTHLNSKDSRCTHPMASQFSDAEMDY